MQQQQQEQYAQELHDQWTQFASRNRGHTADDLVARFQQGGKQHLDLAEKYKVKAEAFERGADAIDNLREGLREIADDYNQRIANIENSNEPSPAKTADIARLVAEANGFAAYKSGAAIATIMDGVQKILTVEGVPLSSGEFLNSEGLTTESSPKAGPADGGPPGTHGAGGGSHGSAGIAGDGGSPGAHGAGGGSHGSAGHAGDGGSPGARGASGGSSGAAGGSPPVAAQVGIGHVPGAPAISSPAPGGGGLSPAAFGGQSPASLANSFTTGMMAGQPAAADAHKFGEGILSATGSASPAQAPVV
ncbi:MAG TPA: hypothetical protein VFI55_04705, partial [Mycobacterium sp.]|nr:hypothetical protein [Mycobacterium sp.]